MKLLHLLMISNISAAFTIIAKIAVKMMKLSGFKALCYRRASKSRFFDGPLDFRPSFCTLDHHRNATRKRRYRADLRSFGRKAHQAFYNAELEQGFDSVEAD